MKILACIKQVPDTAAQIWVNPRTGEIDLSDVEFIINPYDELAVEEAVRIKEHLGGEVIALTMGPERAEEALRKALAMGADEAVHLLDPAFNDSDTYATGRTLASAIRKLAPDLVLCGKKAVDGDTGQVPAAIAEGLDAPLVCYVAKLEVTRDEITAHRQVDGGIEVVSVKLPVVVTVDRGINEPRYPALRSTMAAKKKPISRWDREALGLTPDDVGLPGSKTRVVAVTPPKPRATGRFTGTATMSAADRLKLLMSAGASEKSERLVIRDPAARAARRVLQILVDENLV